MPFPTRRLAAVFISVMLLAGFPFPGTGASGGRTAAAPPHAPSSGPGTDVAPDNLSNAELLSQNLTVVLDPGSHGMSVEGQVRVRANYRLTEFTFFLHETLDLTRIEENGQELNFTRWGERLAINLSEPLPANGTALFNVSYSGTMWYLENGLRQDCIGWDGAYVKGSTFWYLRHHAGDWADYRLKFCCPANWTAVADGDLVAEEHAAGWSNYTWVNDRPCLRPAFAAGNYSVSVSASGALTISSYIYPQHAASAKAYLDEAAKIMEFYSGLLGAYERKTVKVVETGHETMAGYACSGFVMLYQVAFSGGGCDYELLSHELGHMWFPYATGYQSWGYQWLWEAFPEYLSCLYERKYHGSWNRLDTDRNAYIAADLQGKLTYSIVATDWATAYSYETLYAKGAWVLHMLRGMLGDDQFNATLRDYVDDYRYGYGSARAFITVSQARCPFSLDGFWDQWLNRTRDLDVSLPAARLYDNGTSFRLELEPVNLRNASNPADIAIDYIDGTTTTVRLGWDGKARLVTYEVPNAVSSIRLDPDGWLLDVDPSNNNAVPLRSGNAFDLSAAGLQVPPGLVDGCDTAISAVVRDNGSYDAEMVPVDILVDGAVLSARSLNITAGSGTPVSAPWRARSGHHVVTLAVDPDSRFHDWDRSNNNLSLAVDVALPPPRIDLWCGNLSMDPAAPAEGDRVNFSADVRNAGEAALAGIGVAFSLDGVPVLNLSIGTLAPGAQTTARFAWTAVRGTHRIQALADPLDSIRESDETNNQAVAVFQASWKLQLRLSFSPREPKTLEAVDFLVDGNAGEFSFDFGDGSSSGWGPENRISHEYRDDGDFTAAVRGRSPGAEGTSSATVHISNRAPESDIWSDPAEPMTFATVVFVAKAMDLDGTVVSIHWEFGDGSGGDGARAEHVYSRPGRYTVGCTVTDNDGATGGAEIGLWVQNRDPVVSWYMRSRAVAGETVRFQADARDPDGNITSCRWDFGDGGSASGAAVEHAFRRPGRYLVSVVATDDAGGNSTFGQWVVVEARPGAAGGFSYWIALVPALATSLCALGWLVHSSRKKRAEREYREFFGRRGL